MQIQPSHQLKAAPLSYEKTVSRHFDIYVHPETYPNGQPKFDEKGKVVIRLNRRGRRNKARLARSQKGRNGKR